MPKVKPAKQGDKQVLHIVPALFDKDRGTIGGAERYVCELARHMAEVVPTELLTFGEKDSEEQIGKLRIRIAGDPWYVRGQRLNPLSRALFPAIRRADIVHCHQQHVLASTLAALACRMSGRRVFTSDLGGGGWDISSYVSTDRLYHGYLHISEYSRQVFGHQSNPRAHVILGGVDTDKFSPDESCARDGSVLFVGRLLPHKGIQYLIEAMPPNLELRVVGPIRDQVFYGQLRALAAGNRVTFIHDCDDAALVSLYRQAMCVVLPSVYKTQGGLVTRVPELLGQTLLEGMACATCTICTDVASMPEIVVDGVTGFVVPPNDPQALRRKLEFLRDNPVEAASMGREGRRRVLDNFTWPTVVNRCLAIYRHPNNIEARG
ncbi:MAG TPA: glycosyltransferase family 4 protein [Candidatus Angelobacter sp.]|nr:glycosyltransferase family 4 protein [Candidatus Angelobacter sp.]